MIPLMYSFLNGRVLELENRMVVAQVEREEEWEGGGYDREGQGMGSPRGWNCLRGRHLTEKGKG